MPTVYHQDGRIEEVQGDEVVWSWPENAKEPVPGYSTGPEAEVVKPVKAKAKKPAAKKAAAKKSTAKKKG